MLLGDTRDKNDYLSGPTNRVIADYSQQFPDLVGVAEKREVGQRLPAVMVYCPSFASVPPGSFLPVVIAQRQAYPNQVQV